MSLVERSVTSITWNASTNLIKIGILVARSIILARLLPVETFGVYALATSIVTFSGMLPMFGMGSAYLHRSPETSDEEQAAAVHFTLRLILTGVWAAILILLAYLFTTGPLRIALIVLTLSFSGLFLADTPKIILTRRVEHRRLAVLDLLTATLTTLTAVVMANQGYDLWALLATDVVTLAVAIVGLYIWRPVWRPRLLWLRGTVRYYLRFGGRTMAGGMMAEALDNVDDIWIGANLGQESLGFYSRAYTFATYPRRLLAFPVNMVAGGTYAELKEDRHRLSQAFFRTNALLVRSGFLMGGALALVAPEFVAIALGEKWLPMVPIFRLMTIFTLLDPIRVTVSQVFVAAGKPEQIVRVRALQLAVLVAGLFLFGRSYGVVGVAILINIVFIIGLIPLLNSARQFVDFSVGRLFAPPALAALAGGAGALGAVWFTCRFVTCPNDWVTGFVKGIVFVLIYLIVMMAIERQQMVKMMFDLKKVFFKNTKVDDETPVIDKR